MDNNQLKHIQSRLKDDNLPDKVREAFEALVKKHGIHGFPIGAKVSYTNDRWTGTVVSYEEWLPTSGYTNASRREWEEWVPVKRDDHLQRIGVYYPIHLKLAE